MKRKIRSVVVVVLSCAVMVMPGCVASRKGLLSSFKATEISNEQFGQTIYVSVNYWNEHESSQGGRNFPEIENNLLQVMAKTLAESGRFDVVSTTPRNREQKEGEYNLKCDVNVTYNFAREFILSPLSVYTLCIIPGFYIREWSFHFTLTDYKKTKIWENNYKETIKQVCWLPLLPLALSADRQFFNVWEGTIKDTIRQMLADSKNQSK